MIADAMAGLQRWIRAQYWSRRDHVSMSRGAADAGLPVALNAAGLLDGTIGGGTLTGGGTVATGGYTLVVPASITAAGREAANVFTAAQTIQSPTTTDHALTLNMPNSATGDVLRLLYNSVQRIKFSLLSNDTLLSLAAFDNGAGVAPRLVLGRNNNATTPAPGFVFFESPGGTYYPLWADNVGDIRTAAANAQPISSTVGTVVGTQTSSLDSKDISGEFTDNDKALAAMLATPVFTFVYKNGRFDGEEFTGIVTDYSPIFGMDGGRSFNPVSAFGYTVAAFKALERRIAELEAK